MKHTIAIQLRFNDTDALGHINNSTYFTFYDLGKSEYFRTVRGVNYFSQAIDIVVAHAEVDYIEPVFLTDEIAVETRVMKMGNKSFTLEQQIVDINSRAVKSRCVTVMVGYDFRTKETKTIAQEWRKSISKYEERADFLSIQK